MEASQGGSERDKSNPSSNSAPITSVASFWREFDLEKERSILDEQGLRIAENQENSQKNRRKLAESTRDFKKAQAEEKASLFNSLLRGYQEEVDNLTKREKFGENAFLNIYQKLYEAPDPYPVVSSVAEKDLKISDLESENRKMKVELEEFRTEATHLKNQQATIRRLEERTRQLEQQVVGYNSIEAEDWDVAPVPERNIPKTAQSLQERAGQRADKFARSYLIQALPNEIYTGVDSHKTARDIWKEVERHMQGTERDKSLRFRNAVKAYEGFKQREGETLKATYHRFCNLVNDLRKNGVIRTDVEYNFKFLEYLIPEWEKFTIPLSLGSEVTQTSVHGLYEALCPYEDRVLAKVARKKQASSQNSQPSHDPLALVSDNHFRRQPKMLTQAPQDPRPSFEPELISDTEEDLELSEIKNALVALTTAMDRKLSRKTHTNNQLRFSTGTRPLRHDPKKFDSKASEDKVFESKRLEQDHAEPSTMAFYNCGKPGHFIRDSRVPRVKTVDYYKKKASLAKKVESGHALIADEEHFLFYSDEDDEEVPPPEDRLCFMPDTEQNSGTDNDASDTSSQHDASTVVNEVYPSAAET